MPPPASPATTDLQRYEKAVAEGRFQTALDLAKALHKAAPSRESLERLRRATLARGRQLREHHQLADARAVLNQAVPLVADRPDLARILAEEFAQCGDQAQALAVLPADADDRSRAYLSGLAADAAFADAVVHRPAHAPPDLRRVLAAFDDIEAGRDPAARDQLAGIGLTSPFAEYRLMLRGLLAYHAGDDARARDNWARLDPARLPARWVAPLRAAIDPDYAAAQPPAIRKRLAELFQKLQPNLAGELRGLSVQLSRSPLGPAFHTAQLLLPRFREQAPDLIPRLADAFLHAIVDHGAQSDLDRFTQLFDPPPDDPRLDRARALAEESRGDLYSANVHWKAYENWVAAARRFGEHRNRARALIWERMGLNAHKARDGIDDELAKEFEDFLPDRAAPKMDPPAEACFRRAIELAPDLKSAREHLITHLDEKNAAAAAADAMRDLLRCYPDDQKTLQKLAVHTLPTDPIAGRELALRALAQNPLDRRLRRLAASAHRSVGRLGMAAGEYAPARTAFAEALALDPHAAAQTHAAVAVLEYLDGRPGEAAQQLARARAATAHPVFAVYHFVVDALRSNLPKQFRAGAEAELADAIHGPPEPDRALGLVLALTSMRADGREYRGAKTHEKKIRAMLDALLDPRRSRPPEAFLVDVCRSSRSLKWPRTYQRAAALGHRLYPENVYLTYALADALLRTGRSGASSFEAFRLASLALRRYEALPIDRRDPDLGEQIQELIDVTGHMGAILDLGDLFGGGA